MQIRITFLQVGTSTFSLNYGIGRWTEIETHFLRFVLISDEHAQANDLAISFSSNWISILSLDFIQLKCICYDIFYLNSQ